MLNKNPNSYNIEKNFKCSIVISTFSEHITIFQILSIDIWQLKCQQRQTNKTKRWQTFFLQTFQNSQIFLPHSSERSLWNQKLLFSIFSQTFLELIFTTKINTMLLSGQLFCLLAVRKILRILYVWTVKILFTNKRILT